ncbi:D-tyrosyl-tRNA(Tyr) deacylase [Veillonella montpellierensis DNF00314]|uniref:D-aminoacyl-tRNA deacylase n=1 Tax=Veillonella montpellierensis DNF00314 TaxID=1401067 RepID=A0A096BYB6_9FIRM|nr:D-aminoacyl-tRNA deacylase [Veillonella montpellierensis]KGF47727.1 D-tyrosyl-tRNA(Tyr) deacylase [Veillonella montpellierensis DNF00314]
MRAVVQRVTSASVSVDAIEVGKVKEGLLVFLGISKDDTESDANYIVDKISHLRIFEDAMGKMNESIIDKKGDILLVSQFTLYGDVRHGRRPSFTEAASPEQAQLLYEYVVNQCRLLGITIATGTFQSHMMVELTNDGPVTILLDSKKLF